MDAKREAYPFAGALCVAAGNLMTAVHQAAGSPPTDDVDDLSADDRRLWTAAGVAYGAAASCAALSARLLLVEREALREHVAEIDAPRRFELGVTTLEATEARAWRATVRAAAAARAELARCAALYSARERGSDVADTVRQLTDYVDELAAVLERIEPNAAPEDSSV